MIKQLLIGASALALTTTAVQAQVVSNIDAVPVKTVDYTASIGTRDTGANATTTPEARKGDKAAATAAVRTAADISSGVGATTIQNGTNAGSTINAVAAAQGNTAIVDQAGPDNLGDVNQLSATRGVAVINQTSQSTSAARINKAYVTQSDNGGNSGIIKNNAYIQQVLGDFETGQTANITQAWDSAAGATANSAAILQGSRTLGDGRGINNAAAIDQTGAGNDAVIAQIAYNGGTDARSDNTSLAYRNKATVTQNGANNVAAVQQTSSGTVTSDVLGAPAGVWQSGNNHKAYVTQRGQSQTAGVSQSAGNGNFALVDQGRFAANALSKVTQVGSSNEAWNQQGTSTGTANDTKSLIEQTGTSNYGEVRQFANSAESELRQVGDFNQAYVTQDVAATSAFSWIRQTGNNNVGVVYQNVTSDYASINQAGNGNTGLVRQ